MHQTSLESVAVGLPAAAELDRALRNAAPNEVIATALKVVGRDHLALVSSFGTESAALLKVMADVDPAIPVIFLDTGWLFDETLRYRDTLIATLGLRDVRSIKPLEETLSREEAVSCLDQRAQALSGRPARGDSSRRARRRQVEIQSLRQCLAARHRGDLQHRQPAAASIGRIGLPIGRVHALYQPHLAGRGRARRPLARATEDRMRHPYDEDCVAQRGCRA